MLAQSLASRQNTFMTSLTHLIRSRSPCTLMPFTSTNWVIGSLLSGSLARQHWQSLVRFNRKSADKKSRTNYSDNDIALPGSDRSPRPAYIRHRRSPLPTVELG